MTDALGPKPPRSRARLWVATLLLAIYAGFVAVVTLWPNPNDLEFGGISDRVLKVLYRFGVPEWFGFDEIEFTANIGMFIPLGFFLGLALPRRAWWLALFLVPGYSGFIEWTQATSLESRVSSMLDVFANTAGGYIGILLAMTMRAMIYARDRRIIARAIWERDAEILRAREHPLPQQPGRVQQPGRPVQQQTWHEPDAATRVFEQRPTWQDPRDAPTERLPF
ncbi:hypothetical protein GCM10022219_21790 [Microbacterium oryzae]|uniref:VanZ family protein n=1 Tax=Microbacterium oryzae TaxID=743009 RepID=A0A6I6E486_9MICO|nr:VanZ family protein [Microbacterium oryzae]QGU27587.1 VanZ family protein [Microbacterium oryzae]